MQIQCKLYNIWNQKFLVKLDRQQSIEVNWWINCNKIFWAKIFSLQYFIVYIFSINSWYLRNSFFINWNICYILVWWASPFFAIECFNIYLTVLNFVVLSICCLKNSRFADIKLTWKVIYLIIIANNFLYFEINQWTINWQQICKTLFYAHPEICFNWLINFQNWKIILNNKVLIVGIWLIRHGLN